MLHDLQFAFRQLIKYPAFTAVAAVTLALGIGVNTTMFSVLNAIVLQASASPDSSRLVAQRTSEIGIRMALGAQKGDVLWLVLGQGVRLAFAGTAIGLACSFGLVQVLKAALPAIPGKDPVAVVCISVLMAAVAVLACWLPARRATRVNPIIALRAE